MTEIVLVWARRMFGRVCCCTLALILSFHLAGCEPESDLRPGQTVIHLVQTLTSVEGEVTETEYEFISNTATVSIFPHYTSEYEDAWSVSIPLVGTPTYYVAVIFKSPGPNPAQLATGDGQGYVVTIDVPEREHGGDSIFDGVMHITEKFGQTWSGNATVGVDVEVMSYGQEAPAGEIIRIESVRFYRIPVE